MRGRCRRSGFGVSYPTREKRLKSKGANQTRATAELESPPRKVWALALIVFAITLAFSPVLVADYIRLDDGTHVVENPGLQGSSGRGLLAFWTEPYFSLYVPVTYSVWWLVAAVAQLFGPLRQTAWLFHATNLLLHLANTCLVFLTIRTLLLLHPGNPPVPSPRRAASISLLAALLFGLHPVQVETVAWISEGKGALSMSLVLLGIWSYYNRPKKLVIVWFGLAMLAKPTAIVAPGILLLIDRVLLGRSLRASALLPAVMWLLLLPLVVLTKHLQPDGEIDFVPTLFQRGYVAMDALGFYGSTLFAPVALALDYGRSPEYVLAHVRGWRLALSILVLLAALAIPSEALVRPRPGRRWYSFVACGWSVFVLSLLPVAGLIPFKFQTSSTVADHYMYVAVFGAALALAGILSRLQAAGKWLGITALWLALLGGLSFRQAAKWRSTEALFAHTFGINPRSFLGHYCIASDLFSRGRWDDGIVEGLKAVEIKPDYLPAHFFIGLALLQKGEINTAIEYYSTVLARDATPTGKHGPLLANMHDSLGLALCRVGRRAEGVEHFRKALEVDPQSFSSYMFLGDAALEDGRYQEAILRYERALALRPGHRMARSQLARARQEAREEP